MAGAAVGERAARAVVDGHRGGSRAAVRIVLAQLVRAADHRPGRQPELEVRAEPVPHERRLGERGGAKGGYLTDDDAGPVATEGERVVEALWGVRLVDTIAGDRAQKRADALLR